MSKLVYSSRIEDSLLKSLGPYSITITARCTKDFEPEIIMVSIPKIFGSSEIYGEVIS